MEFTVQFCIFAIFLLFLLDYFMKPKQSNVLPYRLPFIGNVIYALFFIGEPVHKTLSYWSQKYGPKYTIQVFSRHFVVLNNYEDIYEMLVTKGKEVGGRIRMFRTTYISKDKGIVFSDYSEEWKKRRNHIQKHLKQFGEGLGDIQTIVLSISQDLNANLREKATEINGPFDPYDDIYMAVINSLSSILTGITHGKNDEEVQLTHELTKFVLECVSLSRGFHLDVLPFLRFFGDNTFKKCDTYLEKLSHFVKLLQDKSGDNDKTQYTRKSSSFMDALLKDIDINDADNKQMVHSVLGDILVGGVVTSATTLYCFMQIMAQNRNTQEKLYQEISHVLHEHNSSEITLDNRNEMPYTRACLLELQRYISLVPIAVPHKVITGTEIGGEFVGKETILVANLWQLHHDERYWENPWKFQPERFLDTEGNLVLSDHINRKRLLSFGAGIRVCVGQTLAMARLFIFVTNIVKEFEITDDGENIHDPQKYGFDGIIVPPRYKLSLKPRPKSK